MSDAALGALAAVAASVLFSVGLVLQAIEARGVPRERRLGLAPVLALLRRPRWLLGGALMVAGFGLHVTALLLAPLTLVQPALAAGLLVLLAVGRVRDREPLGARELAGVAAITLGVVGLTLTAPSRDTVAASGLSLVLALGGIAALVVLPQALARAGRGGGGGHGDVLLLALAAGAGYAVSGVTTKLLSDALDTSDGAAAAVWLAATVLAGAAALVNQTLALQRGGAVQVGVIVYVVPVIVPVLAAPVLVGEGWGGTPASGLPLGLSVAAVSAGAAVLAASQRVRAVEPVP